MQRCPLIRPMDIRLFLDVRSFFEIRSIFHIFRYVCEVVSRRASFMASAGITALLKKMDYKVS